jgi:tetratricopeptide (TPR) repeat protein
MDIRENHPASAQELLSAWNKLDDERLVLTNQAAAALNNEDFIKSEEIYLKLIPFIEDMIRFAADNTAKEVPVQGPCFSREDGEGLKNFLTGELVVCYANLGYAQVAVYEPKVNTAVHTLLKGLHLSRDNSYIKETLLECMNIVIHFHEARSLSLPSTEKNDNYLNLLNEAYEFLKAPEENLEKAAEPYQKAIEILPGEPAVWHGLGLSLFTTSEAKAIDAWVECYKLNKEYNFDVVGTSEVK